MVLCTVKLMEELRHIFLLRTANEPLLLSGTELKGAVLRCLC